MSEQHPITPPLELVDQWDEEGTNMFRPAYQIHLTTQAARWGADQELEACCEWFQELYKSGDVLRAARRPKPSSLKEQALEAAQRFYAKGHENCTDEEVKDDFDTIRRALEALDD